MATFYTLTYSYPVKTIKVDDNTLQANVANISLPGKNYLGYGNSVDQTLLNITEHFASSTSTNGPNNPILGQIWYDATQSPAVLRYYDEDDPTTNAWVSILSTNSSIDSLLDVDTTTTAPTAGQGLVWDSGLSKWTPQTVAVAPSVTFSVVTPPTIAAAAGDEYYVTTTGTNTGTVTQRWIHDGTSWVQIPMSDVKKINDLTDVDTATVLPVANESIMMWNALGTQWVPGNVIDASPTGGTTNDF